MNLDDESLLSAYLDDELDAPGRAEVESALHARPDLRRRLAELASVRDLLSGLSRPAAPADLSAAIVARLAARPPGVRYSQRRPRRAGLLIAAGLTSLAASLMIARVATEPARPQPGHGLPPVARKAPVADAPKLASRADRAGLRDEIRPISPAPLRLRRGPNGGSVKEPVMIAVKPASPPPPAALASAPAPIAPADSKSSVALADNEGLTRKKEAESLGAVEFRDLLNRPGVRRLTVTVDDLGEATVAAMTDLVGDLHKAQPRWGKIQVEQTFSLDPDRPGQAIIYAMVLDRTGQDQLDRSLQEKFPDRVVADELESGVAGRLARSDLPGKFSWQQGPAIPRLKQAPAEQSRIMALKNSQDVAPGLEQFAQSSKPFDARSREKSTDLQDAASDAPAPAGSFDSTRQAAAGFRAKRAEPGPSAKDQVAAAAPATNDPAPAAGPRSAAPRRLRELDDLGEASSGRQPSGRKTAQFKRDRAQSDQAVQSRDDPRLAGDRAEKSAEPTTTVLVWLTAREPGR